MRWFLPEKTPVVSIGVLKNTPGICLKNLFLLMKHSTSNYLLQLHWGKSDLTVCADLI